MQAIHRRPLARGVFMLVSFAILFALILLPIAPATDGGRLTGLQYADSVFNSLSKGSSYFIPASEEAAAAMLNRKVNLATAFATAEQAALAARILKKSGMNVAITGNAVAFEGDLGQTLKAAVRDADYLYHNDGAAISAEYDGAKPLAVAAAWWHALNPCIHQLQKQGRNLEAAAVQEVIKRAIEPGNNFYGIKAEKVSANLLLVTALLLFYICYTLWYGFGIYEIFDGLGLMGNRAEK